MSLAHFTSGEHSADCTGCAACNERLAATLDEEPYANALRHAEENDALARAYRVTESLSDSERLAREIQGYGSVCVSTPDAYAPYLPERVDACPLLDEAYRPYGQPADGYLIARAITEAKKEQR